MLDVDSLPVTIRDIRCRGVVSTIASSEQAVTVQARLTLEATIPPDRAPIWAEQISTMASGQAEAMEMDRPGPSTAILRVKIARVSRLVLEVAGGNTADYDMSVLDSVDVASITETRKQSASATGWKGGARPLLTRLASAVCGTSRSVAIETATVHGPVEVRVVEGVTSVRWTSECVLPAWALASLAAMQGRDGVLLTSRSHDVQPRIPGLDDGAQDGAA